MPPRARAVQEDSRTETPTLKEKLAANGHTTNGRRARNGATAVASGSSLKEVISAAADPKSAATGGAAQSAQNGNSGLSWKTEDRSLLQAYRNIHTLPTPAAFSQPLSHVVLNHGIGKYSPTMARQKAKRRISKDQLALAIRKNFNALAVKEDDVTLALLYKVKEKDKEFRRRFAPRKPAT